MFFAHAQLKRAQRGRPGTKMTMMYIHRSLYIKHIISRTEKNLAPCTILYSYFRGQYLCILGVVCVHHSTHLS